jgi:hypothetical protein
MASLPETMSSSTSRPVVLRMRSDLSTRQHRYHGKSYWVVKEPIGLNYFRFHDEEYAILNMLNGRNSMDDIKDQFEREFRPQKITYPDLQQFVCTKADWSYRTPLDKADSCLNAEESDVARRCSESSRTFLRCVFAESTRNGY